MLDMYKGVVNSPETTTTNDINNTDTLIYVLDETRIPEDLPNIMTLGTGTAAETIKVLSISDNAITVERGFQGIAKSWNQGTIIARNFAEYDYNALKENIEENDADLVAHKADNTAHGVGLPTETVITTGFSAGWSGTIRARVNQEGLKTLSIDLAKTTDISGSENAYTFSVPLRALSADTHFSTIGASDDGALIANSQIGFYITIYGDLILRNIGSVTVGVRRFVATVSYY